MTDPRTPHRKYFALVLLPPLAGAAVFHSFVVHAILTNVALNGLIVATAAAGALLILQRMRAVRREWAVFARFAAGSDEPAPPASVAGRLLAHLARMRRAGRASPIEQSQVQDETADVQHVLESRQEAAQYVVGLMIALGLLGTFIGLLETLVAVGQLIGGFAKSDASGDMDQALAQLIANLQYPLTAMGTAFSASMFGLLCSLMLGLMMLSLRAFQADFMQFARGVVDGTTADLHGGAAAHAGSSDDAVWVHRLMEMQAQQQTLHDEVRQLGRQAAGNEARQRQLLAAFLRAVQALDARDAQAAAERLAATARLDGHERLLAALVDNGQALTGGLARLQQAAEAQTRGAAELAAAVLQQSRLARESADRLEAALVAGSEADGAESTAYEVARATERIERELRTGLGALADLQRQALRESGRMAA